MNYRRLGRTGLQVSEIGLGTVELGLDYGVPVAGEHLRPPEEHAARLLNQALDLGVNFIDTARAYGASEEIIGRALKGRRGEYILASKLAPIREEGQSDGELAEQVKASIAESLRMLQTDVIDLLQLHWAPADVIAKGRVLAAAREAQRAGQVRFIGASTYGEEAPLAALAGWRLRHPPGRIQPGRQDAGGASAAAGAAAGRGHHRALGAAARGADPSLRTSSRSSWPSCGRRSRN